MSLRIQQASEVIIARSKRTGKKYPARASHLAGHRRGPYLHYTDGTRFKACRCLGAQDHEELYLVNDDDSNLAIVITRYMDKFDLESCRQPDFLHYQERQKIEWALKSVHAERFHYVSKDKNIVCRCSRPDHLSRRRVQNPDVQELCAEFFLLEATQTMCTRDQWRAIKVAMTPKELSISRASTIELKIRHTTPKKSSFEYDSPSVVELLRVREACSLGSHKHCPWPPSDRKAKLSPSHREDMAHFSNGPDGEVDIPEDVWRVSRPPVYLGQYNIESLASTPIGTSATPAQRSEYLNTVIQGHRPSTLELGAEAPGVTHYADVWYDVTHGPSTSGLGRPINCSSSRASSTSRYSIDSRSMGPGIANLEVDFSESPRAFTSDSLTVPATPTHIAEFPSLERAIELDGIPMQSPYLPHHSPTLRELEGGSFEYVAELAAQCPAVPSKRSKESASSHRLA